MDKARLPWLGQAFAAIGVITSLCLVAYEMKLSRDVALAGVYQQRTEMEIGILALTLPQEHARNVLRKTLVRNQSPLSSDEYEIWSSYAYIWLMAHENSYFQNRLGLLTDEEWENQTTTLKALTAAPCFVRVVEDLRASLFLDFKLNSAELLKENLARTVRLDEAVECPKSL